MLLSEILWTMKEMCVCVHSSIGCTIEVHAQVSV